MRLKAILRLLTASPFLTICLCGPSGPVDEALSSTTVAGPLALTSPISGQTFARGDTVWIRWTGDSLHAFYVMVDVRLGDCAQWEGIGPYGGSSIVRGEDDWENYPWPVPDSLLCEGDPTYRRVATTGQTCMLRVEEYGRSEEGFVDSVSIVIE